MTSLIDTPKHNDLIYDIGMHKAEDTEFYLRKGFRVVSFEANPDLVRQCRERLDDFVARGQLAIVEGAIIDLDAIENKDRKTIGFYKNDNMSVLGTIQGDWAERNKELGSSSNGVIDVDVIDFAGAIQKYGMPHYMKIDIEGCDMICVKTLKKFSRCPDYISIESDKTSFANIKNEIETLADLGYTHFKAVEQSEIHLTKTPPNPATEGSFVPQSFEVGSSGLFGSELGNRWKSERAIIRQYSIIRLGYYLLGDDGVTEPVEVSRRLGVSSVGAQVATFIYAGKCPWLV